MGLELNEHSIGPDRSFARKKVAQLIGLVVVNMDLSHVYKIFGHFMFKQS